MSFYCEVLNSKFSMSKDNAEKAVLCLQARCWSDVNDYQLKQSTDIYNVLLEFMWSVEIENGNVTGIDFNGSKFCNEFYKMFDVIALYVDSGSFIEMASDTHDFWRYRFKDGKLFLDEGKIVFHEEE